LPPNSKVKLHVPYRSDTGFSAIYALACVSFFLALSLYCFITAPDWFAKILCLCIVITLLLLITVIIIFYLGNRDVMFISEDKLVVKKGKIINDYPIDSIAFFIVITTFDIVFIKKELFIVDYQKKRIRIYFSDNANNMSDSWDEFCFELGKATRKKVIFKEEPQ
jgi:hypothetical protein